MKNRAKTRIEKATAGKINEAITWIAPAIFFFNNLDGGPTMLISRALLCIG